MGETMALLVPHKGSVRDAEDFEVGEAGGESTVAAYLADLGHPVAWLSRLGTDALGDRIADTLSGAGVDLTWVIRHPEAPTGIIVKDPRPGGSMVSYYRAGSAASTISTADVDRLTWDGVRAVHVTGVTPALSPECSSAVDHLFDVAGDRGVIRSFDVNHRPALWPGADAAARLGELAAKADLVFVGADEATQLWSATDPDDVRAVVGLAPELIVKDAPRRVTVYPSASRSGITIPVEKVTVVEPIGAGDAFAAGYLSALLRGGNYEERVVLGHRLATLALSSTRDHVDASALRPSTNAGMAAS